MEAVFVEVLEESWQLRNGIRALLRPLGEADLELHWELFCNCSPQSIYQRFFQVVNRSKVTDAQVARFVRFDRGREVAIAAVQWPGGGPEMGVVRLVRLGSESLEFAVLVADPWHRQGLGRRLVQKAIAVAGASCARRLEGYVLGCNQPMLGLCRRLGFAMTHLAGEGLYQVRLELPPDSSTTGTAGGPGVRATS